VILIDGDIVAYRCAYKSIDDRAEYAAYSAGSYLSDLISDLYILIEDEPEYRVFLTGRATFDTSTQSLLATRKTERTRRNLNTLPLSVSI
jgi:hypothetical protein